MMRLIAGLAVIVLSRVDEVKALRMRLTQGNLPPKEERGFFVGNFSFKSRSSPSNAQLQSAGEIIPPCGVPSVVS